MSTSGSYDFTVNRDEIIREASDLVGSFSQSETIPAAEIVSCARKLNLMVKALMAQGVHLWAMQEATLFLTVADGQYSIGPSGDHCTNTYVQTTLSTDEATSSTSLGITSATGMSASDNIGIVLDDGTIHWTTISGAPGTTTTIATGLASAATAGNVVFAYTSKIQRPLRIETAYRRDINNSDVPLHIKSRAEYAELANKTTEGKPVQLFYDPQLTTGLLSVWPTPDLATDVIRFWYERPLQDFDVLTDNPDFPIEWGEYLIYGLAVRMAPGWGVSLPEQQMLKAYADEKLEIALGFDKENTSSFFQPDR